ncbi:MAG: diaminopimelate decarboxylase [Gammaproteobacteria bacterium]|nr:diaminopimelate decarboxylase [Gammaproteobacteria bacterium]
MSSFNYIDGELHAEQVSLRQLAAQFGTPLYVYSRSELERQWRAMDEAFGDYPHQIYYAVKANSNLAVLQVLAQLGSGFDIVSGGELQRVLAAGGGAEKVVFSGVAKSEQELELAIREGVHCINAESEAELNRIQLVASRLQTTARVGLRINPDVDPKTHPYISTGMAEAKFGINMQAALARCRTAVDLPNVEIIGIACHIGSQIVTTTPFTEALQCVLEFVDQMQDLGISLQHLDLGGGLGIDYNGESPPSAQQYVGAILSCLHDRGVTLPVGIEPGRFICANAGLLLTQVEYLKSNGDKRFAVIDAGMNDLLRPALYQAEHRIVNVIESAPSQKCLDVVGPVCESSDVMARQCNIAAAPGDLLAIMSAGAYGFGMASNYNSRPRAAEVMVQNDRSSLIRRRESFEDLVRGEQFFEAD